MKNNYKLLIALICGFNAFCGGFQTLHAQALNLPESTKEGMLNPN